MPSDRSVDLAPDPPKKPAFGKCCGLGCLAWIFIFLILPMSCRPFVSFTASPTATPSPTWTPAPAIVLEATEAAPTLAPVPTARPQVNFAAPVEVPAPVLVPTPEGGLVEQFPVQGEAVPTEMPQVAPEVQEPATGDAQVWVNDKSGVYHYRGTRWYGNTSQGHYSTETQARAEGNRAAQNGQ